MVLKAYAVETHVPYTISNDYNVLEDHELYLTDGGLDWLLSVFTKHSLAFLRSTFQFVFSQATEDDIDNIKYTGYNNFRGITGNKPKAGTKQRAVLVHKRKEYLFDTLREARHEVLLLSRFYPIDEFTLYRIRKNTKKDKTYYYRDKVPILLKETKRGRALNLPHLRK
jgi:hypothetical protein